MAGRSVDDQLARLEAIRSQPLSDESIDLLRKSIESKANLVAAKAATVATALKATALESALVAAFTRFLDGNDKGCLAKTAIVKALAAMEADADDAYLKGARHVQMEPTWGGQSDVAVELRCESVAALVRMNSRQMWDPLVRLFADADPQARCVAARALGATGHDHAKWLIQHKLLVGDREPNVMAECFTAAVALTRSIELVAPFLDSPSDGLREAAILAIGESHLPQACELLVRRSATAYDAEERRLLYLAIAMSRQPQGIDHLISLLSDAKQQSAEAIVGALAMYRSDPAIRGRVEQAARISGAEAISAFEKHFRA